MAIKTIDGTVLTEHRRDGFKEGPSRDFVEKCVKAFFAGKTVEPCLFGTTSGPRPYSEYPILITAVTLEADKKDMCIIEGKFDYSRRGYPAGSKTLHGKRIRFTYNMHNRVATHVYSEG